MVGSEAVAVMVVAVVTPVDAAGQEGVAATAVSAGAAVRD